jgi:hypothetical protein
MTVSDYINSQIALACWRAAKSELHPAMLAVCMVFKNRANAGWFEGDIYTNSCKWLEENPGEFPDVRDPQFQQLLSKIDSVTSGLVPDKTGGALWFGPKTEDPIAGNITMVFGNMIFVR